MWTGDLLGRYQNDYGMMVVLDGFEVAIAPSPYVPEKAGASSSSSSREKTPTPKCDCSGLIPQWKYESKEKLTTKEMEARKFKFFGWELVDRDERTGVLKFRNPNNSKKHIWGTGEFLHWFPCGGDLDGRLGVQVGVLAAICSACR